MLTVLFWNFAFTPAMERMGALDVLASLAHAHAVDILALADTKARPGDVLAALNEASKAFDLAPEPPGEHPGIQFYTRFPGTEFPPFRSDRRLDVRRLRLAGYQEMLLAAIHFFDRRNYDPGDQASKASGVYQTLRDAERDVGHTRTVVFGDLNMNPFEPGLLNSEIGFAALPTRELARRHSSDGAPRFYNPMWSRLGREAPGPPGTYYYDNVSKPLNHFWHHLDQVLIRPALFGAFPDEEFRILTTAPGRGGSAINLVQSTGKHWKIDYSDHLPILFKLDPPKEVADA